MQTKHKKFFTLVKGLISIFLIYYFYKSLDELFQYYLPLFNNTSRIPISLFAFILLLIFLIAFLLVHIWYFKLLGQLTSFRPKSLLIKWSIGVILSIGVSWLLLYSPHAALFDGWWFKSTILIFTAAVLTWLFTEDNSQIYSFLGVLKAIILLSSIIIVASELQMASSYPFSLGWSEGNRLWDYSILYGRDRYQIAADQSIPVYTSVGRQSLWGLVYLIPNASTFLARLWDVILFTVPYFILGLVVFHRKNQSIEVWLMLGIWSFLFLRGGPIYTPLVLAAILVASTRKMPLWLSIIFVSIAGYYATESRFTWVFAAGMWAALIAFLDTKSKISKSAKQRWLRAIILGLSGVTFAYFMPKSLDDALLSLFTKTPGAVNQAAEVLASGEQGIAVSGLGELLGRQPLLWQRLLPNPTYTPGILLGLLITAGPLIFFLYLLGKKMPWKLDLWQKLLLFGELIAFLIVGLIISVKIGGGGDLHNLDMFLITLLIVSGLIWHGGAKDEIKVISKNKPIFKYACFLVVFVPALLGVMSAKHVEIPSKQEAQKGLNKIQSAVDKYNDNEILFIDQRQLLTFGFIKNVNLVPEYEKKQLMDMAMADDANYFEPFIADMQNQRFSLIVSEPLYIQYQEVDYEGGFGQENNSWVNWVSIPILCNYESIETNTDHKYELLIPRSGPLPDELQGICP